MTTKNASTRVALTVMITVFFMWGFITSLNDVLIPHLKQVFDLDYTQSMLVQFTFFGAYFVMSLPAGKLVSWTGYRNSIVIGLLVTGVGSLLFLLAARNPTYALFLFAFFTLASGITILQVAANPYVSMLGAAKLASSRLNMAQAFNSLGTTLAPMFGGILILSAAADKALSTVAESGMAYRLQQAQMVELPYLLIAAVLLLLAIVVFAFHLPPIASAESDNQAKASLGAALKHRHVKLGVLAIFLYVGAEVSIGSFLINYISLPQIGNIEIAAAAKYVAMYWGGAMVGRAIGVLVLRKVNTGTVLGVCALVAAALLATTMMNTGMVAVVAVVSIGLFNSVMFPNIFTLGIEGLGSLTGSASSLLIMAIVGGAIVPVAQGALADNIGVHHAFIIPLVCYLYIAYYGFVGSKRADAADDEGSVSALENGGFKPHV